MENAIEKREKQDQELRDKLERIERERDGLRERWQEVLDRDTTNSAV